MNIGRSLHFCMITTFYPPYNFGGDGIFIHRLSNELARRGHQVEVIHCQDSYRLLAGHEPAASYDDHPNVTVHGLRAGRAPEGPRHVPDLPGFLSPLITQQTGYPFFKGEAIQSILDKGFDVIHYHNISLVGGPKVLEYGQSVKLYTMHEYWLICPTHVLFKFNRVACTRPQCLACSLVYKRPPQWWRYGGMLKAAVKHVDAFLATSLFSRDMHQQRGLEAPIVHLPYFVPELPEPRPTAEEGGDGERSGKPYFLFVGRLSKLKGLQTLIPVFRNYPKAGLLIAGKGDDEAWLRQMAAGSPNIRFLGLQSNTQLQALYRRAVALIMPSIVYETFGQVIIEAFQHRTPAIVRRLGAMTEVVEQGGGLAYATGEELLAAMERLLADRAYRDELGRRGYQAYRRYWTADAHLERYFALIDDLARTKMPC
jgi:glycosyltransferase involved in cell wall biosynthesis